MLTRRRKAFSYTAEYALGDYWLRVGIMTLAKCSMHAVNCALQGKATPQKALRIHVLDACEAAGVDVRGLRRKLDA